MVASLTRRGFLKQAGGAAMVAATGGSLLSACGGSSTSTSAGPVTLTFGWWSNGPVKDNAMKAWAQSFTKTHPTITIQPEILSWGDYWNKLQTTVAGGNPWDIMGMASIMAASYYDQGALMDLSTFSDYTSISSQLNQTGLQLGSWKGKPFGLPVGLYVPLLGYNKTLLKKAGVPFPDQGEPMDFSSFKEIAQKLSIKSGSQYTQYALNMDYCISWTDLAMMEGAQVYDNIVNPKTITLNTPEGIKGLADWQGLFLDHIAVPYSVQGNGPFGAGDIDSLLTNKVAFARMVLADFNQVIQQNLSDQIGVAPMFGLNGKVVTAGGANCFSIYANAKHPQETWEFIKWAATDGNRAFGQISDIPANIANYQQAASYIQPTAFAQSLVVGLKGMVPTVMTPNPQFSTDLSNILADLGSGKVTPTIAAQQLQTKGQADINAGS